MSDEIQPVIMSAEEIRLRERRSFDAFNEAQARRGQMRRDAANIASADENKRWIRPEVDAGSDHDTSHIENSGGNDTPGG